MAYGAFIDITDQTNPVANTARPMRFDTTIHSEGVSVVDGTRITVEESGVYDVQFSAQIVKTDVGVDTVDIWLARNGTYEPYTTTRVTLNERNNISVASWNVFVELGAGEYAELYWSSADTGLSFATLTGLTDPVRPSIPSLILTVDQVG